MASAARIPDRVLVTAAPGYGKSRLVAAARGHAMCRENLNRDSPEDLAALARDLERLDEHERIILTTCWPLDAAVRASLPGRFFERDARDLALGMPQVARLLREDYEITDPEAASVVHRHTAGWPALVHFAADALARAPLSDLPALTGREDAPAAEWLRQAVIATLPTDLREDLGLLAGYDPISQDLWDALADALGRPRRGGAVATLRRLGLLVPWPRTILTGEDLWTVVPLLADVVGQDRAETVPVAGAAAVARWYADRRLPVPAAGAWLVAGAEEAAADVLADQGDEAISGGGARDLLRLRDASPVIDGDPRLSLLLAEARQWAGDMAGARSAFSAQIANAPSAGWPIGLATRVARLHFATGQLAEAKEALARVDPAGLPIGADVVHWHALRATVLSMLGEDGEARAAATQARAAADIAADAEADVAAEQALAKTDSGAAKAAHLENAAAAAIRSRNVWALAGIRLNQAYVLLSAARFADAVPVCREAVLAAELSRPAGALTAALHNLAEALVRTGEYEEARGHLDRAVALARRSMANRAASGLCGLGDLHRILGHQEEAATNYDQAVALSRESGELQVLVPALSGWARVLARRDPAAAQALAREAAAVAPPSVLGYAALAAGWVAHAGGDLAAGRESAQVAMCAAREAHARDLLAEALELAALCADHPEASDGLLDEARAIWRGGGADVEVDRLDAISGSLAGASAAARSRGRLAAIRLRARGIRQIHGQPVSSTDDPSRQVVIRVLGRFEVEVDGRPVPHTAWRSRQARTLVKLLAARRGRAVTRGLVCETLWPGEDTTKTAHRLAVLLATVRGVLDPAKQRPSDHFIAGDSGGLWLDLDHVAIDLAMLIDDVEDAAGVLEAGENARARELLTDIDRRYRGPAFEDEPDADWARYPRDEARTAWHQAMRQLAVLHLREQRVAPAHALMTRLIAEDPYDERIYRLCVRSLVRTGRHGEARRVFEQWVAAMDDLGAPRPDGQVLGTLDRAH